MAFRSFLFGYLVVVLSTVPAIRAEDGVCGPNIKLKYSQTFSFVYDDRNTGASGNDLSVWRVNLENGWYRLGDVGIPRYMSGAPHANERQGVLVQAPGDILRPPTDYTWVWDDSNSGGTYYGSFWKPIPPSGYTCLGHVLGDKSNYNKPSTDLIRCVKNAYVVEATTVHLWADHGTGGSHDGDLWTVIPKSGSMGTTLNTLYGQNVYSKPSDSQVHTLNMDCIDGAGFPSPAPTPVPTSKPTPVPTSPPSTAAPTSPPSTAVPTSAPTSAPILSSVASPPLGGAKGDPHFLTFGGAKYDFHGGCDLVLLDNPGYANVGMSIHIRTKIETWWSFIDSAVLQIGSHTLEVKGNKPGDDAPQYWVNGVRGNAMVEEDENLAALENDLRAIFAGFKVHHKRVSSKQHKFRIDLNHKGDALSFQTFNSWVSVNVKAKTPSNFDGALGLMGSYPSGSRLARDGVTVVEDPVLFGKEWQVQSEPMLFHSAEGAQYPEECAMPGLETTAESTRKIRRRLGEALITEEDAKIACEHAKAFDRDACVFDVLATNDRSMAGAY